VKSVIVLSHICCYSRIYTVWHVDNVQYLANKWFTIQSVIIPRYYIPESVHLYSSHGRKLIMQTGLGDCAAAVDYARPSIGFTASLVIGQCENKGRNRKWKGDRERSSALRRKYTTLTHAKQRTRPNMAVWPTQCLALLATEIMYNAEGQLNPSLLVSPRHNQPLRHELGTPSATRLHVQRRRAERRPKFHSFPTNFGHVWPPTDLGRSMIHRKQSSRDST